MKSGKSRKHKFWYQIVEKFLKQYNRTMYLCKYRAGKNDNFLAVPKLHYYYSREQ